MSVMNDLIASGGATLLPTAVGGAVATVVTLCFLQSDRVSRSLFSPTRLMIKRRQEYQYRWKKFVEKINLQVDYYLLGGVLGVHASSPGNTSSSKGGIPTNPLERIVNRITGEAAIQLFVDDLVSSSAEQKKTSKANISVTILKIDFGVEDSYRIGDLPHIFLLRKTLAESDNQDGYDSEVFQLPLIPFTDALAKVYEARIILTAFCFVADASSGAATQLIEGMLRHNDHFQDTTIISQPSWMVSLTHWMSTSSKVAANAKSILFALCRLEAQQQPAQAKSIVITLPGQSVTSAVLPVLQQAFPDDRHVFAYDGCMASVQRAMQNASSASFPSTSSLATTLEGITTIAPSSDSTIHSIPTLPYLSNQIRNLPIALSQIPVQQAQVVESWMSSVDAFFALKHDENSNGYLPYVLKYELLMQQQQGSVPDKQDLFWSVASLLQFITGTKSSGLDKQIVEDVMEWLQDAQHEESASTTTSFAAGSYDMAAIENCVFQHKSILIGDKTLQDTVLPKEHWTLKQASRKGGCACCAPEEDEEDDSNTATGTHGNGNNHASTKPSASTSSGFVDGKLSFAFDPTRFS